MWAPGPGGQERRGRRAGRPVADDLRQAVRERRSAPAPAPAWPSGAAGLAGRTGVVSRVLCPRRVRRGGIICLGRGSLRTSSGLPGTRSGRAAPRPCLASLRMGFAMRPLLPAARCALTAPFHPCLCPSRGHRRSALCGTFRRLAAPGRYPASCPAELGLSSTGRPFRAPGGDSSARPSGKAPIPKRTLLVKLRRPGPVLGPAARRSAPASSSVPASSGRSRRRPRLLPVFATRSAGLSGTGLRPRDCPGPPPCSLPVAPPAPACPARSRTSGLPWANRCFIMKTLFPSFASPDSLRSSA